MPDKPFIVRPAKPQEDQVIAGLVVEGFLDKFRPIFGRRMDQSIKIMESWVRMEHSLGGVSSLVVEGPTSSEITASVGVRIRDSETEALARGFWKALRHDLGFIHASWTTILLSYPHYTATSSEAYVERLVVTREHRRQGIARALLEAVESLSRESGKDAMGLHVSGSNLPALKLYEAYGYQEISRQRSLLTGYFLGIRDWLYLQKKLR
jgi:ribosomal protein S18 acetylase RimI-like enzyme